MKRSEISKEILNLEVMMQETEEKTAKYKIEVLREILELEIKVKETKEKEANYEINLGEQYHIWEKLNQKERDLFSEAATTLKDYEHFEKLIYEEQEIIKFWNLSTLREVREIINVSDFKEPSKLMNFIREKDKKTIRRRVEF
ncbi:hypothetical protein [Mesomycoplasma molare]|uniref:Uncharacterized protein n=1 Tax=Mesomycoplasma molare TaxID=171288 RepID=A0ABY5TUV0_9BACT|nr:hypothetical protein [Mesomycoplasma molare]UWD34030.1 hypothetical protein NX772_02905 [Mesomycoplasma molare]